MDGRGQRVSGRRKKIESGAGAGGALQAAGEVDLPEGPCSLQEVLDFPDFVWQRLFTGSGAAEDRLQRLKDVLKRGIDLSSQYSGKGTAETAAAHLAKKFSAEGLQQSWLQVASAFDIKGFARDVLKCHTGISRPHCVFSDMHVCLSQPGKDDLAGMEPEKSAAPDVKAAAYERMIKHVKTHAADLFPRNQKGPCFMHGRLDGCEVFPKRTNPDSLLMYVAGQVCKDVSRRGSRQGFAGAHTKAYVVWLGMVRARQPELFVHEITTSAEAKDRLHEDLKDLYDIHTYNCLSPHDLGIPVQRLRQYSVGILRNKLLFVGSWQDFFSLLRSRCVLSGDIFFQSTREEQQEVARGMASRHGWYVGQGDCASLEEQLTPAQMRRFHEYKKLAQEKGVTGFYTFDVGQDVGFGPLCQNLAPCLVSHGQLVHGQRDVVATPMEHLLIMGRSDA